MVAGCFANRLNVFAQLTSAERQALAGLEERERRVRRGSALLRENDRSSEVFIIAEGMMMNYVLLDNGSRQILRILYPGDLLAMCGIAFQDTPETIAAMADSVVFAFDRSALSALGSAHPRLLMILLAYAQIERVILTDRLASMGRTTAKARVAAILLELRDRMARAGLPTEPSYTLGLTQEEIGDATGLTAVHVNRMLRQLEDEGLIERTNGRMRILDERGLAATGHYSDRYKKVDLSWLTQA